MIQYNAPHPGRILRYHIDATNKTVTDIAKGLCISRKVLSAILNSKAGITAEMAMRLSKAFHTSPEFWVNLQTNFELSKALAAVDTSRVEIFEQVTV